MVKAKMKYEIRMKSKKLSRIWIETDEKTGQKYGCVEMPVVLTVKIPIVFKVERKST